MGRFAAITSIGFLEPKSSLAEKIIQAALSPPLPSLFFSLLNPALKACTLIIMTERSALELKLSISVKFLEV